MRIIAGDWRGRRLVAVGKGDPGGHLRPTTDRVRESLFNMLAGGRFGDPFDGAQVLDLFAGTGALGLEALSRGAAHATFVEKGRAGAGLIRENIAALGCEDRARLLTVDALRLPKAENAATLIFLDPPYGTGLGEKALRAARDLGWVSPDALVVWEDNTAQAAPDGYVMKDNRRYGDTWITVLRAL